MRNVDCNDDRSGGLMRAYDGLERGETVVATAQARHHHKHQEEKDEEQA